MSHAACCLLYTLQTLSMGFMSLYVCNLALWLPEANHLWTLLVDCTMRLVTGINVYLALPMTDIIIS